MRPDACGCGSQRARRRAGVVSLVLLTASFVMMRGFHIGVDAGTGASRITCSWRDSIHASCTTRPQTQRFYELLVDGARATSGVESAGLTQNPPLGLDAFDRLTFVPDLFVMPRDRETFAATMDTVDEGFFGTMDVTILRGRGILRSDGADAPRVAVVNEQFAKHYWPDQDAVGKHIRLDGRTGPLLEIVGIARTIKYRSSFEKPVDFVYLPVAQRPRPRMVLLLRSAGDPHQLVDSVERIVHALDANMPISDVRTYADVYRYNVVEGPGIGVEIVATMGAVGSDPRGRRICTDSSHIP